MTQLRLSLALFFCIGALFGCKSVTPPSQAAARTADELKSWQASGRIAVSGRSAGGSGTFAWVQDASKATVRMHGPIGIGSLRLDLSEQGMRIATADGEEFEEDAAAEELSRRLGAVVPAQDLRYWLRGIAAPGEHSWANAADGAGASLLEQHEWRIAYEKYGITDGVRLPMRLVATSGPAKVKIVIDKWKVK